MWNVCKNWLDEKTRKKVNVVHNSGTKDTDCIDIKHYPRLLDGQCNCNGCQTGDIYNTELTQQFIHFIQELDKNKGAHYESLSNDAVKQSEHA